MASIPGRVLAIKPVHKLGGTQMKKVLALAIVVIILAAMAPVALAAGETVYVSVSVDGNLEVAAAPIALTDLTVESAIKAVHAEYYSGGESGYVAGTDPTWGMYLITQFWGVAGTPYVIVNGAPVGSSMTDPTVDSYPVKNGDNIVISISSDPTVPAQAIALTVSVDGDFATVTATNWALDFTTFAYTSSPLAGAAVIDPATGTALGTTDDSGSITVPAGGVVAIDGLAAIPADGSSASTPDSVTAPAPAAPAEPAAPVAPGEDVTVYVTVSLDGVLQIAAQPVTVNIATADAAIKAAHAQYYSGGESGYGTGIDPTWGMFMINTCWGVNAVPYVVKNGAPLGTAENADFISADVMPISDGDNIILVVSSTGATFPTVSLKLSDDNVLSAQSWVMDFQTFAYTDSPMANYQVIDAETGEVLGETDALGKFKLKKIPDCGVVALTGLAAIPVGQVKSFTAYDGEYIPPVYDYSVFGGPNGKSLLRIVIIGAALAIPLGIVVLHAQRKELKNRGVKFAKLSDKHTKQ